MITVMLVKQYAKALQLAPAPLASSRTRAHHHLIPDAAPFARFQLVGPVSGESAIRDWVTGWVSKTLVVW
jgi:hypothetical protein